MPVLKLVAPYPTIPFKPCSNPRVIVEIPAEIAVTLVISIPKPTFLIRVSRVSLVILFFKSLVTTSPSGDTLA